MDATVVACHTDSTISLGLEARKVELQSRLEAQEMPELLHPRMSDVYREKVGNLCLALESEESRTDAVDTSDSPPTSENSADGRTAGGTCA